MPTKLIFLLIFIPCITLGQNQTPFSKLITETNHYLNEYGKLSPFGDEYLPISDFGLSKKEIKQLIKEADYDEVLTEGKDSVQGSHMVYYFQEKITHRLDQIIKHPDFAKNDMDSLITSDELSIIQSDDHKLINFSFDEKTGGTYRSRVSMMFYTDFTEEDSTQQEAFQSFFASDGYGAIHTLQTEEGTKYLLTGYVRGCSYCFETYVQLITFIDNEFVLEFEYSVSNRDWNDGVFYEPETKTIIVDYHVDDLTSHCSCNDELEEDEFDHEELAENEMSINCSCKFLFNGKNFELIEEGWRRVNNADRED